MVAQTLRRVAILTLNALQRYAIIVNFTERLFMKQIHRPVGQILILLLSLIGTAIAVYLTTVHDENSPLICSTSGVIDCALVLVSRYAVVPGTTIPVTIPGLCWCLVSIAPVSYTHLR